jgi:hypothetical protein
VCADAFLTTSAVSALDGAGVSRSAAMAMTGHLTESVYRRFAIADETSLKEAGVKLAALHNAGGLSTNVPFAFVKAESKQGCSALQQ